VGGGVLFGESMHAGSNQEMEVEAGCKSSALATLAPPVLRSLPLLQPGARYSSMLAWLQLGCWAADTSASSALLRLHSVERELFSR